MSKPFLGARLTAVLLAVLAGASSAQAGGGPENVFLVVNAASWASQTVANHFIQLRQIPSANVLYIDWTGGFESVDADTMRGKILIPTLDMIEKRGLLGQIDYVVYSSDFPYTVDLLKDFPGFKFSDQARPDCSITSVTYLWNLLLSKIPVVMDIQVNYYMRTPEHRTTAEATRAFRSWYGWGARGELLEAGGQPYMLSTMLAMTSGRGNSVREAIAYLRRSAAADGTHPKGTIYFSKTDDVRSKVRANEFASAVEELNKLGVRAKVLTSVLPSNRPDVMGLMTGAANFSWPGSHSKILPGAFCEAFTSFGGVMTEGASQTPLSEFLRYGAAGSSGTVTEPYAIAQKFPSPQMHVHYARGCTLAEAYYQAVFGPSQLLIVGDPLCRPWAHIPAVQVAGVQPDQTVSGEIVLHPKATSSKGGGMDHYELFVDGRRVASDRGAAGLRWDSRTEADGFHELRVVAVESGPIETQGRAIIPVIVNNQGASVELATTPAKTVRWGETLSVHAKSAGASKIFVVQNNRVLGLINGDDGQLSVNPRMLGTGPVALQALAVSTANARGYTSSSPLPLVIEPPTPLPPLKDAPPKLAPGMALKLPNDKVVPVDETRDPAWLALAGVNPNESFLLQGFFDVAADDMYQFQLWHYGDLKLTVDSTVLFSASQGNYTQKFVPVALATGKHRLTVSGTTATPVKLRILFGGPGAVSLNATTFQHPAR
jgi:hypothetical protein